MEKRSEERSFIVHNQQEIVGRGADLPNGIVENSGGRLVLTVCVGFKCLTCKMAAKKAKLDELLKKQAGLVGMVLAIIAGTPELGEALASSTAEIVSDEAMLSLLVRELVAVNKFATQPTTNVSTEK